MSFIGQSPFELHFWPITIVISAVDVAWLFDAHRMSILWNPSGRLAAVVNVNGAVVSVCFGIPSTDMSTSWMPLPSLVVQVTWTWKPACCALPSAGEVILTTGVEALAGPNSFLMICTSFCV